VIGSGEKGRVVQARFGGGATANAPAPASRAARTTHPRGALLVTIAGGAIAAGGGALIFYGLSQIPSQCSITSSECAAPPNDPVFAQAASGARTVNLGIAATSIGLAALAGGVVWYVMGAKPAREAPVQAWLGKDSGGFAVRGSF
jgi:hypothetical protein